MYVRGRRLIGGMADNPSRILLRTIGGKTLEYDRGAVSTAGFRSRCP